MRKIILNLAVSLDGFIEDAEGKFDWCFTDQDYGMSAFTKRIDAVFIGRKSYDLVQRIGGKNPYADLTTYVFSNTLKKVDKNTNLVNGSIEDEVTKIIKQPGKDIWLFGGASLVTSFINANLVDELQLAVHPVVLGGGKPLFQNITERKSFVLTDTKHYSTGLAQLFYERKKM
ncbi:MAG: dihydrofolate reductase [Ignavibacteriales bacterium]|nr:dihydrofolate reductase [Ignavibacteriales bacterium]